MKPLGSTALLKRAADTVKDGRVDVVKLANALGINVFTVAQKDETFNANIKYSPKTEKFEIYVNDAHPATRQRFSVAHELSHYALEPDAIVQKGSLDRAHVSLPANERKADELAAKLLMPDAMIDDYFKQHNVKASDGFTAGDIEAIASYFNVSRAMAVQRLREKGCTIPYLSFA
jgi:Zn-dependent peptidase ImmA (M78 family)